jgi:ribosome biogenesis GTPase A
MNQKQAHWYPGHMNKAIAAMVEKLSWIDVLVIVVDARAMRACMDLPVTTQKPILYVMTKTDLADPAVTKTISKTFQGDQHQVVESVGLNPKSRSVILKALHRMGEPIWQKQLKKGLKKQPLKTMIIGVPNVGKSSLINLLAKQRKAVVENRPGTTRGQQWIKLDELLLLLDTPGILPPRYEAAIRPMQLALIGAMPIQQLPVQPLAEYLFDHLKQFYPQVLVAKYGRLPETASAFFHHWGQQAGWIKQGHVDIDRVYPYFIQAFQKGDLGRISLPNL